ncbi:class D sortase [Paenibacillus chartarius]|uniref:Class D sortase n=1 Tax=Paenibacillus chartarius TaxID=747481 RepID=A0ABV6DRS2_9BACL
MNSRKWISTVCILAGLCIFLYPTIADRYESYRQQQILKQWEHNLRSIDQGVADSEVPSEPTAALPSDNTAMPEILPAAAVPAQAAPAPAPALAPMPDNVEGILTIDKIDLKLPILTDATMEHMKISIASIANTAKAGAVGNYAIAGHRNRTYGKNFNRLDEVAAGDLIQVDTGAQTYTYRVEDKLYVLPEEVWVLKGNGKDREITLITCHPIDNPTHRIVVKGKLVESNS